MKGEQCPTCGNEMVRRHGREWQCRWCGTIKCKSYTIIPEFMQWKKFEEDPPMPNENIEYEFIFDIDGKPVKDIGVMYEDAIVTNARYVDDFGGPIYWRQIGPMPKVEGDENE